MNVLKSERMRQGLTQFELSKKSNVLPNEISKIETGQQKPFPKWQRNLCEALGLPIETDLTAEAISNG